MKYWIKYDFSNGYVTKCLNALHECAEKFVLTEYTDIVKDKKPVESKKKKDTPVESDSFFTDFFEESIDETPRLKDEAILFNFKTGNHHCKSSKYDFHNVKSK